MAQVKSSKQGNVNSKNAQIVLAIVALIAGMNIIAVFAAVNSITYRGWGIAFGIATELAGALLLGMALGAQRKRK